MQTVGHDDDDDCGDPCPTVWTDRRARAGRAEVTGLSERRWATGYQDTDCSEDGDEVMRSCEDAAAAEGQGDGMFHLPPPSAGARDCRAEMRPAPE